MVKVKVRVMEGVVVFPDAIKMLHDQFPCRKRRPPENRNDSRASFFFTAKVEKGQLTTSRTRESFARDWNDRLLSE